MPAVRILLRKSWSASGSCSDSERPNCVLAEVTERKTELPGTLTMWNPLYLATIYILRMRETGIKDNSKVVGLCVSGMLVILLTEIGKSEEGAVCGEKTEELNKMDFRCALFPWTSRKTSHLMTKCGICIYILASHSLQLVCEVLF